MIDNRILELLIDSFPKLLIPGLTMTIPLTAISFCLAMIIAVVVAMFQFAHVRVLEQICMLKDTSLASTITVAEMFMATQRIAGRTFEYMPLYLEVAVIYLLFTTVFTRLQRLGEKKLGAYQAKEVG